MENDESRNSKRKKDKHRDDDEYRRETKSKRMRSRSRSPQQTRGKEFSRKRRRSRSLSQDPVKQEKSNNDPPKDREAQKEAPTRKAKDTDMLNTRTGGAYIPPARLRMMQAQITDKSSVAYQRLAWEALKKSIHGHINKINVGNIGIIIKELLKENIVRGRGLLCRSVIQAQAASPTFTNVYAALVAAVNSRFPNIGELLLKRLVIQFKRGFKRNDKPTCISSASFIAHLVNQRVAHEILALELLTLLVETPTDDSVEVAIAFLKECGQKLTEVSSKGVNAIFEMLRNILHEGQLDKRVQYMIEVMFQVWKDGFKDHPALIEELELVPEEEQFTHLLMLDDATDPQDILNVFKFDDKYEENEQKYKTLSKEILGSDAESGEEDGSEGSGSEEEEEEEAEREQKAVTIIDNTETNLVALRRTIYLTINSSLDFEECAHKLLKMELKPGQEVELCHMFLDCCAEQRTYEKFYGLLAQRFCNINRMYIGPFEEIFKDSYGTAHRLDTNRLRNVSKFFAHLLYTDSISWEVLECVKLNEEDTTSSSRIYIKILFQELAEFMGLKKLNDRLKDPTLQDAFSGIFPRDNPKNTRFSINFFTSIGLGGLTDELREHLKQMPKNVPAPITEINLESESSSDSSSSSSSSDSSSSDSSSSDSEDDGGEKKSKKTKNKAKKPQTSDKPEEPDKDKDVDRWGHDGFYDTYGKDARRTDNRTDRRERDDNNFARPREIPRRNDDRDRYRQRNGDDRRRLDDRTREEDYRRANRDERDDRRRDMDPDGFRVDRYSQSRGQTGDDARSRREPRYWGDTEEEPRRRNREENEDRNRDENNRRGSRAKRNDRDDEDSDEDPRRRNREDDRKRNRTKEKDLDNDRHKERDGDNTRSTKDERDRRYVKNMREESDHRKKKNEKENLNNDVDSSEDDERSKRREKSNKSRKFEKESSDDKRRNLDSSDEDKDRSKRREKSSNKKKKYEKVTSGGRQRRNSESSDEDDSRNKGHNKESKKDRNLEKENRKDRRKNKDVSSDEDEKTRRRDKVSRNERDVMRKKSEDTDDDNSKRKRNKSKKKKSRKDRSESSEEVTKSTRKSKGSESRYLEGIVPMRTKL